MADFAKIAEVALPVLAGAASAFDPYRNVSRGLNQAVVMRSQLKGRAERSAFREKAEERAEADQQMQEQRQSWAEQQYGWAQEQRQVDLKDAESRELWRQDLIANSPEEHHTRIKAARTSGEFAAIKADMEKRERGGRFVDMMKTSGLPMTPQEEAMYRADPGYAQAKWASFSAGQVQQQRATDLALNEYKGALDQLNDLYRGGKIDALEYDEKRNKLFASAPGQIGMGEYGEEVTPEQRQEAVDNRLRTSPQFKDAITRADNLYDDIATPTAAIKFEQWEKIKVGYMAGKIPFEYAEMQRMELQAELEQAYQSHSKAASELTRLGYEKKPRYVIEPLDRLNPETIKQNAGYTPTGAPEDAAYTAQAEKNVRTNEAGQPVNEVEVQGHGFPPGMSPSEVVSEVERRFVTDLAEEPANVE